ncbi:hypothetical protein [Longimicrobium sp.]|uniref:hypothetical protein n=1 Tax=Longimicrobium sp. TaxID=2029185 RepID=UPI002E378166|nr:hypothetical protein [Longimicrobium sp.]HEX6039997.1 hypothetical protein [Longimicrobium sp.]
MLIQSIDESSSRAGEPVSARYPDALREWAGHRSGGVRRLFDTHSGRPTGKLIGTALLYRLRQWAASVVTGASGTPRIVLLIGGPGNGKTEAVEETLRALEKELGAPGKLQAHLRPLFAPNDGSVVPRRADVDLGVVAQHQPGFILTLVQDASVGDDSQPGRTAAELLADDIDEAQKAGETRIYLACVNRGVLDDASIIAADQGRHSTRHLLDAIARAVSIGPTAPSCWPLVNYPAVAIWPMDVESLLVERAAADVIRPPMLQILDLASDPSSWPEENTCAAGDRCPFCKSRVLLSAEPHRGALLRILRWYELATGKRWSFRDLFSLVSFLLAGGAEEPAGDMGPCEWAAKLLEIFQKGAGRPTGLRLAAPFRLMAAQYHHVLFSQWPRVGRDGIRKELKELKLDEHPVLLGLSYFLSTSANLSLPATLRTQLADLCDTLDPAFADPDLEVSVSGRTTIRLRDIDARFSHSVREGLQYIRRFQCLSKLDTDVLQYLAEADDAIGAPATRQRKPQTAARLQTIVRDFACRVVRRSLGARSSMVRDVTTLSDYERLVGDDAALMHHAAKQVDTLLNDKERFVVTLNTTFGEPLPPDARRVVLVTARQKVRPVSLPTGGRPAADLRFLGVGPPSAVQFIALTYELFRSVRDMQGGMLPSSLPRAVVASLDATRARLAGRIVRDEEQLDEAEIHVGLRKEVIVREMGQFLVRREAAE